MHNNRLDYSYSEYQQILKDRWYSTLFWLAKKESNSYNLYFAKPTPKTPWLPGKPRQKYYRRLFAKINNQLQKSNIKYSFCTLTYSTRLYSQKSSFLLLKDHLKSFIARLRKRYPKIQYFWICELTKKLYPHIHIVFDQFVHWKVIRAIWHAVSKNKITDIRRVPSGNLAGYLCKYLADQKKQNETQFGCIFKNVDRLWGCSRYFFMVKGSKDKIKEWFLISLSTNCLLPRWDIYHETDDDFWLIPKHYASTLLYYTDLISHIDWFDDYPDIYTYFNQLYTHKEKTDFRKQWNYHCYTHNLNREVPF